MDRDEQCRKWAQEYAENLETFVRRYPTQWSNFFPFWSNVPTPPVVDKLPKGTPYVFLGKMGALEGRVSECGGDLVAVFRSAAGRHWGAFSVSIRS